MSKLNERLAKGAGRGPAPPEPAMTVRTVETEPPVFNAFSEIPPTTLESNGEKGNRGGDDGEKSTRKRSRKSKGKGGERKNKGRSGRRPSEGEEPLRSSENRRQSERSEGHEEDGHESRTVSESTADTQPSFGNKEALSSAQGTILLLIANELLRTSHP